MCTILTFICTHVTPSNKDIEHFQHRKELPNVPPCQYPLSKVNHSSDFNHEKRSFASEQICLNLNWEEVVNKNEEGRLGQRFLGTEV